VHVAQRRPNQEANVEERMSQDILKGQWSQLRGRIKEWWGDLTDDDVKRIDGSKDRLIGTLQERYGYAKERALNEVSRRLDEFNKRVGKS
jgi:uncharacterized protein YjbJ (UPF0337 family)